ISFNLVGVQRTASVSSTVDILLSDIASQQTKAMLGVGSASGNSYGIYFQPGEYTLFKGITYPPSDPNNFVVSLDPGITLTNITFPSSSIVFSTGTGEINGFLDGQNTISIKDAQGTKIETITINRYGVIISKN
ncbi:MAG: hypothetical protein COX78_00530, partial [Candidatus Levybacteria bacterium CG_4_10_14_0_2_um_filter_35_8]